MLNASISLGNGGKKLLACHLCVSLSHVRGPDTKDPKNHGGNRSICGDDDRHRRTSEVLVLCSLREQSENR